MQENKMNCSQDMFEDSMSDMDLSNISSEEISWQGVPLSDLQSRKPKDVTPVRPSRFHQVLFKVPWEKDRVPCPHPDHRTADVWDTDHIRLPHSSSNLFPVSETELKSRWNLIKQALGKPIRNSKDLEDAIYTYNLRPQKYSLDALHEFCNETLPSEANEHFFSNLLPGIIKLALEIEDVFRTGVKLLKEHESRSLSLSQVQAAVVLANAFLCTFPRHPGPAKYPIVNFFRLYQSGSLPRVQEKLKCFTNYFRRVINERPSGVVTFTRRYVEPASLPAWMDLDLMLPDLHVCSKGTIENEGAGLLEVDFANKNIGGGVIGRGSVQEEIKFAICPELVISRLFTETLADTEALLVSGCERFNSHEGYANNFTWAGNYCDTTERDEWGRRKTYMVAIDATRFTRPALQYQRNSLLRELNKAYVGFSGGRGGSVATGNWGCGAFRGDPRLKALLQLMAGAAADVSVAYFTFGDETLRDDIHKMWSFLREHKVTVGRLWKILGKFCDERKNSSNLYEFITSTIIPQPGSKDQKTLEEMIKIKKSLREEKKAVKEDRDTLLLREDMSRTLTSLFQDSKMNCESLNRPEEEPKNNQNASDEKTNDASSRVAKIDEKTNEASSNFAKTSDTLSNEGNVARTSELRKAEPVPGKVCSLTSREGREECLSAERARWEAYRSAIGSVKPPMKRKISDYFPKADK